jgi:hypothetical protein
MTSPVRFSADVEIVFETAGIWNNGSDLTALWKTPHPSGISTRIQETAKISREDFFWE